MSDLILKNKYKQTFLAGLYDHPGFLILSILVFISSLVLPKYLTYQNKKKNDIKKLNEKAYKMAAKTRIDLDHQRKNKY